MRISIGIDVAKHEHWATAITELGDVLLDRRVLNTPREVAELLSEIEALGGERTVGVDLLGGIASLLCAMLLEAGERLVHVPGLAVNRGREGTAGGENKSDPRDARVIADHVRTRNELRSVEPEDAASVELRLLVSRRRELVKDQTRRLARLREFLVSIHPGLERRLDVTHKADLFLLTRYVTPGEIRKAGLDRLTRFLRTCKHLPKPEALAQRALEAAREQTFVLPGEGLTAQFCRELAEDALEIRDRLISIDQQIEALVNAHPDGTLILSLPGMGVTLTAEFLVTAGTLSRFRSADALAAAAGLAPVLRQSGKVRFNRRPLRGNKALKRVFYQSAFCSLQQPESRAFYERKRREGKRHHQAVIALARRRLNVLWAMLRDRRPYKRPEPKTSAA